MEKKKQVKEKSVAELQRELAKANENLALAQTFIRDMHEELDSTRSDLKKCVR